MIAETPARLQEFGVGRILRLKGRKPKAGKWPGPGTNEINQINKMVALPGSALFFDLGLAVADGFSNCPGFARCATGRIC